MRLGPLPRSDESALSAAGEAIEAPRARPALLSTFDALGSRSAPTSPVPRKRVGRFAVEEVPGAHSSRASSRERESIGAASDDGLTARVHHYL